MDISLATMESVAPIRANEESNKTITELMDALNERQKSYVEHLIETKNPPEAVRRAGYSQHGPSVWYQAWELQRNPKVQAAVKAIQDAKFGEFAIKSVMGDLMMNGSAEMTQLSAAKELAKIHGLYAKDEGTKITQSFVQINLTAPQNPVSNIIDIEKKG